MGSIISKYQALIEPEVKADTRKLDTYDAFVEGIAGESSSGNESGGFRGFPGMNAAPELSLKSFLAKRRDYLLDYTKH
jgi:hypothetical protein